MHVTAPVKRVGFGRVGPLAVARAVGVTLILLVIAVSPAGSDGEAATSEEMAPAVAAPPAERMALLDANRSLPEYLPEVSAAVERSASLATEAVSVQPMRVLDANRYLPGADTVVARGQRPQHPSGVTP